MTTTLQLTWERTIATRLKENPKLHLFYSTEGGWAFVRRKDERLRIDTSMSIEQIRDKVGRMLR